MTGAGANGGLPPERAVELDEVRAALSAIQASSPFAASRQLSLFLSYVVEKTLAGEGDRIKAYSIATGALGRPETFDPSADPIVRVEAGRLRKALDVYYQGEGATAPLRIAIPRGSYVPRFERPAGTGGAGELAPAGEGREGDVDAEAPSAASPLGPLWRRRPVQLAVLSALVLVLIAMAVLGLRQAKEGRVPAADTQVARSQPAMPPAAKPMAPRIFVAPFVVADDVAIGIRGSEFATKMATALARFDEVTVVTRMDGDADYVVSGTFSDQPGGIAAATLLTDRHSGHVIWSARMTAPRNPIQPSLTIDQLVGDIAVAIAQPYGVVMSARLARTDKPDDGFRCLVQSFNYWRDFTTATRDDIRDCLEALTRRYPTYAPAYAMLTFVYLDEDGLGFHVPPDSPAVDAAVKAAATAVQLAPTSARAQQAQQFAYFATGQIERALETGKRAMLLNPLDTDVRATQGMMLIVAGQHQLGARLIEESASHNPAYPPWYDLYLALAAFQSGNDRSMRTLIRRLDLPEHPLAAFLAVIAGGRDGTAEAQQQALANLHGRFPELAADPEQALKRFVPNPELVGKLVAASRAAGLQDGK